MTQYLDVYMKCNEFVRDWRIVQTTELPQEYIISRYNAQWMHRIHFELRYSFFNEYLRIINLKLKMQTKSCLGFDFIYICIVYVKINYAQGSHIVAFLVVRNLLFYKYHSGSSYWCRGNPAKETGMTKHYTNRQWPLLLTWFNFNPSMDK